MKGTEMQTVENLDRCIYKVQVSEESQKIIETLADLWGMETGKIFSMMLTFAEHMAVGRILNPIAKGLKEDG